MGGGAGGRGLTDDLPPAPPGGWGGRETRGGRAGGVLGGGGCVCVGGGWREGGDWLSHAHTLTHHAMADELIPPPLPAAANLSQAMQPAEEAPRACVSPLLQVLKPLLKSSRDRSKPCMMLEKTCNTLLMQTD